MQPRGDQEVASRGGPRKGPPELASTTAASTEASTSPPESSSPSRACSRRTSPQCFRRTSSEDRGKDEEKVEVRDAHLLRATVELRGVEPSHAPLLFPLLLQRICAVKPEEILAVRHELLEEPEDGAHFQVVAALTREAGPGVGASVLLEQPFQGRVTVGPSAAPPFFTRKEAGNAVQVRVPDSWVAAAEGASGALAPLGKGAESWTRALRRFGSLEKGPHTCGRGPRSAVVFSFETPGAAEKCAAALQDRVLAVPGLVDLAVADVTLGRWEAFEADAAAAFEAAKQREQEEVEAAQETLMRDLRRAVDHMDLPAWGLGFAHLLAHWIATGIVHAPATLEALTASSSDERTDPEDRRSYMISQLLYMILSRVVKDSARVDGMSVLQVWDRCLRFTEPLAPDCLAVQQLDVALEAAAADLADLAEAAEARSREAEEALVRELELEGSPEKARAKKKKRARASTGDQQTSEDGAPEAPSGVAAAVLQGVYTAVLESDSLGSSSESEDKALQRVDSTGSQAKSKDAKRKKERERSERKQKAPAEVFEQPAAAPVLRRFEAAVNKSEALRKTSKGAPSLSLSSVEQLPRGPSDSPGGMAPADMAPFATVGTASVLPTPPTRAAPPSPVKRGEAMFPGNAVLPSPSGNAMLPSPSPKRNLLPQPESRQEVTPLARHAVTGGLLPPPSAARTQEQQAQRKERRRTKEAPALASWPREGQMSPHAPEFAVASTPPMQPQMSPMQANGLSPLGPAQTGQQHGMGPGPQGYLEEGFTYCEYPQDFYGHQGQMDMQTGHDVMPLEAWGGGDRWAWGQSPGNARSTARRRGGKGKKDRQASSPASSYSGIQFSYAVSSSPLPNGAAQPAATPKSATSAAASAPAFQQPPKAATVELPQSAAFPPMSPTASSAAFASSTTVSPAPYQRERLPTSPQEFLPTTPHEFPTSPQFSAEQFPSSPAAYSAMSPHAAVSPAFPTSPHATPIAAAGGGQQDYFSEVVMLMANGNLEERLRAHENIPYED